MKKISLILTLITLYSCTEHKKEIKSEKEPDLKLRKIELSYQQNLWLNPDTLPVQYGIQPLTKYDSIDSMMSDTTTLAGKRDEIIRDFLSYESPSSPMYDSLFDLNYDGHKDYVIGYYGQSGSGLKNRIEVHLYEPKNKCYHYDSLLSSISNPSFYLKDKLITGFYLPSGGGSGEQYEWVENKWAITKIIQGRENWPDSTNWIITYIREGKNETIIDFYRGIPRQSFLRNNYGEMD